MERYRLFSLFVALFCLAIVGCGNETGPGVFVGDYAPFDILVSRVPATAIDQPEEFELLFADEVPDEDARKVYLDKTLFVEPGSCSVDGNEATAIVSIENVEGELEDTIEWTFERFSEKDDWTIKTAPMP